MKIITKTSLLFGVFLLFALSLNAQRPSVNVVLADEEVNMVSYPLEVMTIINNKCFGCHQPGGKNEKAKEKFQWVWLQQKEALDLVGYVEEVHEVLDEGTMPPEKMLERFPDMKLTTEEVATLKAWADGVSSKLMDE